jgi:hypothetical protein
LHKMGRQAEAEPLEEQARKIRSDGQKDRMHPRL